MNTTCYAFAKVLLPGSSILQIVSVREACCKFLMRQLHPTNCLGIRNFADTHACKDLHKRSHKFALQNFQEVMSTEEFLLLPFQEVVSCSPRLFVCLAEHYLIPFIHFHYYFLTASPTLFVGSRKLIHAFIFMSLSNIIFGYNWIFSAFHTHI